MVNDPVSISTPLSKYGQSKEKRLSLMQTNVHPVCPIGIDTKWHGECWPDFEEGELDGEDLPSV
jgi:hypothetical protein